jgi:mono/diheme cytochrome c family protein
MKKAGAFLVLFALIALMLVPSSFAASADEGKKFFDSKCAVCHGADGAGKIKGTPDLRSADVQKQSDDELAKFIAEGKGKPAHAFAKKGLTDTQIKDLVAYIRTLKK